MVSNLMSFDVTWIKRAFVDRSCTATAAGLAACTIAIAGWHAQAAAELTYQAVLFAIAFVITAYAWGFVANTLIFASRASENRDIHQALLTGSFVICLAGFAIKWFFPIPTALLMAALCLGGVIALTVTAFRAGGGRTLFASDPMSAWAVALSAALAWLWCDGLMSPLPRTGNEVTLIPWNDFFFHANVVSLFATDEIVSTLDKPALSGVPLSFYHFASYIIPAVASSVTGLDTLSAATAIWVPYAFFLMGLSAFVLAQAWWGRGAGFGALIAARLLPDASAYGLECTWFSYYWLLRTGGTLAMGSALAALAFWMVTHGSKFNCKKSLVAGLAAGMALIVFKAQIFVMVIPALVLYAVAFYGTTRPRKRAAIGLALCVCGAALVHLGSELKLAPGLALNGSALTGYLKLVVDQCANPAWTFWPENGHERSTWILLMNGSWILLAGTLGALAPALLILIGSDVARKRLQPVAFIPLIAIGIYLVSALLLEINLQGNPYELHHRPFVWVYFITAIWLGGRIGSLLKEASIVPARPWLLPAASAMALVIILLLSARPQVLWLNKPEWTPAYSNTTYSADYFDAARFIRANSADSDLVQDSSGDPLAFTLAITERQAFLARALDMLKRPAWQSEAIRRRTWLKQICEAQTMTEVQQLAREPGIRWFLLHPGTCVGWTDEMLRQAIARYGDYRVFRFQ
jgi:hypothetical protein